MIAVIEDGFLSLQRGVVIRPQYCPFHRGDTVEGASRCGDWCPKFRPFSSSRTGVSFIQLCQGDRLDVSEIAYERSDRDDQA